MQGEHPKKKGIIRRTYGNIVSAVNVTGYLAIMWLVMFVHQNGLTVLIPRLDVIPVAQQDPLNDTVTLAQNTIYANTHKKGHK